MKPIRDWHTSALISACPNATTAPDAHAYAVGLLTVGTQAPRDEVRALLASGVSTAASKTKHVGFSSNGEAMAASAFGLTTSIEGRQDQLDKVRGIPPRGRPV